MLRIEAYLLLRHRVRDFSLRQRSLATEALMEDLAARLGQQVLEWALAGLLSEVDAEFSAQNPASRARTAADILEAAGAPAAVIDAVSALHRPDAEDRPLSARALWAAHAAVALVLHQAPTREALADVDPAQLAGALGVRPERLSVLEPEGVDPESLLSQALVALERVADDLYPRRVPSGRRESDEGQI